MRNLFLTSAFIPRTCGARPSVLAIAQSRPKTRTVCASIRIRLGGTLPTAPFPSGFKALVQGPLGCEAREVGCTWRACHGFIMRPWDWKLPHRSYYGVRPTTHNDHPLDFTSPLLARSFFSRFLAPPPCLDSARRTGTVSDQPPGIGVSSAGGFPRRGTCSPGVAFCPVTKRILQTLGAISADDGLSRQCLLKLQAICGRHKILPSSYIAFHRFSGVGDEPITCGIIADVWEGTYRSKKVLVQRLRALLNNDRTLKKVRSRYGASSS